MDVTILTPWRRVLLEKWTVTQLVKKFSAFYRTWRFIIVSTRAHHWSQSWIQSTLSNFISLWSF